MFGNPCVYTGARVYLADRNAIVTCDLFEIGGGTLIHVTNPRNWNGSPTPDQVKHATHRVSDPHGFGYWPRDNTLVFVPSQLCIGERR